MTMATSAGDDSNEDAGDTSESTGTTGADPEPEHPPTLAEFWTGDAAFVYQRHFRTPSDNNGFLWYNLDTDIEVIDGTWYLFSREFVLPVPGGCADSSRVVVRSSTDQGATWSADAVIVEQTPGSAYRCAAVDGDAYFDAEADRWHYISQCTDGQGWDLCHFSRDGSNPMGAFVPNPVNPVVVGGQLWNAIAPGQGIFDEGTPQIVERRDGWFYLSFHGFDGMNGYRGLARTMDFAAFEPVRQLFGPGDCAGWNVPWHGSGCIGGGAASTTIEDGHTYMLIEAADLSLTCTENQHWVFGMLRTNDITTGAWEPLPGGPALLFGTHERRSNGNTPACSVQYTRMFEDSDGTPWLALSKVAVQDDIDADPVMGRYLYRLERDAPVADYRFAIGPDRSVTASEVISRGDLELSVTGSAWVQGPDPSSYALALGPGSELRSVDAAALDLRHDFAIELDVRIDALPTSNSAFVAGRLLQYWLELYPNGDLCVWAALPSGPAAACTNIAASLGSYHRFRGEREGTALRIRRDGDTEAEVSISAEPLEASPRPFTVSNPAPNEAGFYGPLHGELDRVTVYGRVL